MIYNLTELYPKISSISKTYTDKISLLSKSYLPDKIDFNYRGLVEYQFKIEYPSFVYDPCLVFCKQVGRHIDDGFESHKYNYMVILYNDGLRLSSKRILEPQLPSSILCLDYLKSHGCYIDKRINSPKLFKHRLLVFLYLSINYLSLNYDDQINTYFTKAFDYLDNLFE